MAFPILHLRAETKALEQRSALTPETTKQLIDAGYTINVERSALRIFDDEDYAAIGATLVDEGSWVNVPKDHIIIGLKELQIQDFDLVHTHIHFGHCYKNQDGWEKYLSRFVRGNGLLYDLEFLTENGRRVSAFGYHAGYAGLAIGLLAWSRQIQDPTATLPSMVEGYDSEDKLQADIKTSLSAALPHNSGEYPRVLVMGALGRSGKGAVDACLAAGIPDANILKWDMAETAAGGPFDEILNVDIFVNCIYLSSKIPPFLTLESLSKPGRKLRTICDVSCDPTNPNNPIPVYTECSTFLKPALPVEGIAGDGPPVTQISIDHLPSLLPREASQSFSNGLLPSLLTLRNRKTEGVWVRAEELFNEKAAQLPA